MANTPSMLRSAMQSIRQAHSGSSQVAPLKQAATRIYNTPAKEEVMKNWKPQVPGGPIHDGWALSRWPFRGDRPSFFFKFIIFAASGFWLPWFVVEYQLKKSNQAK